MKKYVLSLMMLLVVCAREPTEVRMVTTFVYGDVYINESKEDVRIGRLVKEGDVVRTENGKISVQDRNGATILIKEFSKIRIADLNRTTTNIDAANGILLVRVSKLDKNSEFNVRSPTAVAGVRGTTFFVYSSQENTIINSIDGSVAVGKLGKASVVIEQKSVEIGESEKVLEERYKPNITEITDIATLVNASQENIDKARNGNTEDLEKEVEEKLKKAEINAMDIIKNSSHNLNREIAKSIVSLRDGTKITGNVIYQTKSKIFIINENKEVQEVEKSVVSTIDFI